MDGFWTSRNKGKKKSSPALKGKKIARELKEKYWTRILRDSQELGILGMCNKARLRLRQFKGACPET